MSACCEGDDIIEDPIQVILHGAMFASTATDNIPKLSATGPNALRTVASQLLHAGFDGDRLLLLYRGGEPVGKMTIGQAAGAANG